MTIPISKARWPHPIASAELVAGASSVRVAGTGDHQATVVSIRGDIDLATAPGLRELLLPVLARGVVTPVLIDLSEVSFMDSTGVHLLVDTHRQLESQGRRFAVACHEHGRVHRLLGLVGVLDVLPVRFLGASDRAGDPELVRGPSGPASVT